MAKQHSVTPEASVNDEIDKKALAAQLGRRLRDARQGQGFSQESLAEEAGVSVDAIRRIEQGRISRLDFGTYAAITRVLGVQTVWLAEPSSQPNDDREADRAVECRIDDVLMQVFGQSEGAKASNESKQDLKSRIKNAFKPEEQEEQSTTSHPLLLLVGGYAGSGKSEFGKAIAKITGWTVVDKDVIARPMTEQLLSALGGDPNDRHSELYLEKVRPLEYRCTVEAAFRNLECGQSTVVTAPFLREMNNAEWTSRLINRCVRVGGEAFFVWIDCDIATMREHIEQRGAARDAWKIAFWDEYAKTVDLAMRPCVSHVVVDNRRNGANSLVEQAAAIALRVKKQER